MYRFKVRYNESKSPDVTLFSMVLGSYACCDLDCTPHFVYSRYSPLHRIRLPESLHLHLLRIETLEAFQIQAQSWTYIGMVEIP